MTDLIARGSQSLKDQGKSRTTTANILQSLESQSLKDQGKSRTTLLDAR